MVWYHTRNHTRNHTIASSFVPAHINHHTIQETITIIILLYHTTTLFLFQSRECLSSCTSLVKSTWCSRTPLFVIRDGGVPLLCYYACLCSLASSSRLTVVFRRSAVAASPETEQKVGVVVTIRQCPDYCDCDPCRCISYIVKQLVDCFFFAHAGVATPRIIDSSSLAGNVGHLFFNNSLSYSASLGTKGLNHGGTDF